MTPKSPYSAASLKTIGATTRFSRAWRSLAHSRLLPFLLLALGTASNSLCAHVPLVSFAATSGAVLPRRRAIAVAGVGTLLAVIWASLRPAFSRSSWAGHFSWEIVAVMVGFVLYQGLILLAYPLMAEGHAMGWDVVAKIFGEQVVWAGAIALGHGALLWQQMTLLSLTQD